MDMFILSWLLHVFSASLFANASWVEHGHGFYAVSDGIINFVTSQERCSAKGAQLAIFPARYDFTNFVSRTGLKANTRYWISTQDAYLSFTCISLSVEGGHNWMLINSLCSASYQYICQRDEPPNTPLTLLSQSIAPTTTTTTGTAFETTSDLLKTSFPNPKTTSQQIVDSLEPSFESELLSLSKPTDQLNIYSTVSHISVSETITYFNGNSNVYGEKIEQHQNVSGVYIPAQTTVHTNHVELSSICKVCFDSFQKGAIDKKGVIRSNVSSMSSNPNQTNVVERRSTSKYRRLKTSAVDRRTSSKAMGVASVLVISIILLLIVAMDIPRLLRGIHELNGNLYRMLNP